MMDRGLTEDILDSLLAKSFNRDFKRIALKYGLPKEQVLNMGYDILEREIFSRYKLREG